MDNYEQFKKYTNAYSFIKHEKKWHFKLWLIGNFVIPISIFFNVALFAPYQIDSVRLILGCFFIVAAIFVIFSAHLNTIYPNYLFSAYPKNNVNGNINDI